MFELENYLDAFLKEHPKLESSRSDLEQVFWLLEGTLSQGGTVFTCGNGGSASDAEHIAGELLKSFAFNRPIPSSDQDSLHRLFPDIAGEIVKNLEAPLRAIPLTAAHAFQSAFGNDVSFEYAYAQMLYGLGRPGDVLIAISTSGRSKNILAAARVGRLKGVSVVGLTGGSGGALKELCDGCIIAPTAKTHLVQEFHLAIYHFLCYALEARFFGEHGARYPLTDSETSTNQVAPVLAEKIAHVGGTPAVSTVIFDFDGVMTNNKVLVHQDGSEMVSCDRGDGLGIKQLRACGYRLMILSTEANPVVKARAAKLNVACYQDCKDKRQFIETFCQKEGLNPAEITFIGNDINDIGAMKLVGLALCPSDSHPLVKAVAHKVLRQKGGDQVVREVAELLS